MVSLEQVQLLETKVVKVIEHVDRVTGENTLLKTKLEDYQRRIDELEVLIQRFKEEQNRIEDGILAALDRLNQFEAAVSKSLPRREELPPLDTGSAAPEEPAPEPEELPDGESAMPDGGAEMNAPAGDESDDDIIFASDGDEEAPSEEDEHVQGTIPAENQPAELDIF